MLRRSTLLAFAPLVERYLIALEEAAEVRAWKRGAGARRPLTRWLAQMEERGEEPLPVEFPDVWPAVQRAQKSFVREQAVRMCRRGLQILVMATQDRRTAHRLLKSASVGATPSRSRR